MPEALVPIDPSGLTIDFVRRAAGLLAQATTAYDAKRIRDQVVTIETWARERGAADEAIANARRAKILAEIRIGELTKAMPAATPKEAQAIREAKRTGTSNGPLPAPTRSTPARVVKADLLSEAGISKMQASRYERLAERAKSEGVASVVEPAVARVMRASGEKPVHVEHNSGENEWYTPPEIIEIAREAMGSIDLDPASCAVANKTVRAARFYSAEDDGSAKEWTGNVWLNPPYARGLVDRFAEAMAANFEAGRVRQACVLVNNSTDTAWCQALIRSSSAVCFLSGRVAFLDKSGGARGKPLQGQILVYLGGAPKRFAKAAAGIGLVLFAG